MFSAKTTGDRSILTVLNSQAIPLLAGAMVFVTGVAVVLGVLVLYEQTGADGLRDVLSNYFWIVFWTGAAEGVALIVGILCLYLVARRITRPLAELSDAVSNLTRGGQTVAFGTQGPIREINRLSSAFNDLLAVRARQTRELQELTRNVLHDLRTPLTHIRHTAELVHDGKSEAVPAMELVAEACNSVLDIVDTNSEISANYADTDPTPSEPQDLSAIATTLADMYSSVAETRKIAFSVSLPESPVYYLGHRHKLQRMIVNLLDNAFKFTPAGGSVALTVDVLPGAVSLEVSDTGCGISAQDLPHVFDRFYRARSSWQTPGNGLGLSLVHAIATFYRGTVTCRSVPGKRTVFSVLLPT